MTTKDYTITLLVAQTPKQAFKAINNVRGWWTENLEGNSQKVGDEFTVRFGNVHVSKQKIVEVIPDKKVVWLVTDSKLNFVKDKDEWTNTRIIFELLDLGDKTQITFTHEGLVPEYECFDACSDAWTDYLEGSLANLINTGKGQPTPKEAGQKAA